MLRRFAGSFAAGLLALLPMMITLGIIGILMAKLHQWFGPPSLFGHWMNHLARTWQVPSELNYLGSVLIVLAFIWGVGLLAQHYVGERIGQWVMDVVGRVPFINRIYTSARQVVQMLSGKSSSAVAALGNVVLVRLASIRVLGMLASPDPVLLEGVPHYMVFVPASPIPASGQILVVPCSQVVDIAISVEEITRILISLGSLGPGILNAKSPLLVEGLQGALPSQPAPA